MGLTYDGGSALLSYLYNDNDLLSDYDSFEIELIRSNGSTAYNSQSGAASDLVAVTRASGNWDINGNIVTNSSDLTFPPSNNPDSQSIVFFNVYVSGISEPLKLFATGTLNTPININQGETPIIYANDLEIDIDKTNKYTSAFKEKIYRYLFLAEDSFSGIAEYKFVIYNTSGNATPLEFYLTRDSGVPNFSITSEAGGSYAAARNASDVVLPLNQGSNISTDEIRMFYSQGTFPNFTYDRAGDFIMREIGTGTPITYTIANGETARLQTNFLRINSK